MNIFSKNKSWTCREDTEETHHWILRCLLKVELPHVCPWVRVKMYLFIWVDNAGFIYIVVSLYILVTTIIMEKEVMNLRGKMWGSLEGLEENMEDVWGMKEKWCTYILTKYIYIYIPWLLVTELSRNI